MESLQGHPPLPDPPHTQQVLPVYLDLLLAVFLFSLFTSREIVTSGFSPEAQNSGFEIQSLKENVAVTL